MPPTERINSTVVAKSQSLPRDRAATSAAYRRVRRLLDERGAARIFAHVLAVIHAALILSLVGLSGLLLILVTTRGVTHLTQNHLDSVAKIKQLPKFVSAGLPTPEWLVSNPQSGHEAFPSNTGLYPFVATGAVSSNPLHHAAASVLGKVVNRVSLLHSNTGTLTLLLALTLIFLVAICYVGQWRRAYASSLALTAATSLRKQIHRQVYRLGQSALPGEQGGPALDLFSKDVTEIRDGLIADLEHSVRTPIIAVGLLLIALMISVPLAIFLLSLGGLVWFATRPVANAAKLASEAASRDAANQLSLLQEDLGMVRTVRVYGCEPKDGERFDEHLEAYHDAEDRRMRTAGRQKPAALLLAGSAAVAAIWLLVGRILDVRTGHLTIAGAIMLVATLIALTRPLGQWFHTQAAVRRASRSAANVFAFLERRPELTQAVDAQFLPPLRNRITFENVGLDGADGKRLLDGVSFEIPAGSRTAIMGLDEASKHAIACLIPRLIDPHIGRVRMDGLDLRDVTLESLRAQVALVLQSDLTFSDSVAVNIGLGDPSFGLPRIIEAAKTAHAHHFIQNLPHGYDSVIGPMGHYLAPDEAYRIALARALLHDPSIVLIEEPPTSLEDDVKHLIDDTIDRFAASRTLIFLPHRLSTIRKCDQVIVLHNARVESMGTLREVHGQSKLFRHLQYVEFNQFATGEIEAGQIS